MKNRMKLTVIIALVAIFGLLIASCGKLESGLEGEWENEAIPMLKMKISKTSFDYSVGVAYVNAGDKVETKGDEIIVSKGKDEVGKAKYKLDDKTLTLTNASGVLLIGVGGGEKWKKK